MSDSYEIFLEIFNINSKYIITFGLGKSIYIENERTNKSWDELNEEIENKENTYKRLWKQC